MEFLLFAIHIIVVIVKIFQYSLVRNAPKLPEKLIYIFRYCKAMLVSTAEPDMLLQLFTKKNTVGCCKRIKNKFLQHHFTVFLQNYFCCYRHCTKKKPRFQPTMEPSQDWQN